MSQGDIPDIQIHPLLTPNEMVIISDLGEMNQRICNIMGDNHANDKFEVMLHIHALQNMVMSQAARRAFPTQFRQLGEKT